MDRPEFREKRLLCVECGNEFVFEAGEQYFFWVKGLVSPPKRCRPCRQRRKLTIMPAREVTRG